MNFIQSYTSLLALTVCWLAGPAVSLSHLACTISPCTLSNETSLRFFLLGDWGGLPVPPYATQSQRNVAEAMATLGENMSTHFQLTLGDNVYTLGVWGLTDDRFKRTFESIYNESNKALGKPWYIMAGNHDYYGDLDAQMAYTLKSKRWAYPDFYYSIKYELSNGVKIDFIMLDTVILCGNTKEGKFSSFVDYFMASSKDRETQGAQDKVKAEQQWWWLEEQLKSSKANYLFVAGHYPVYSTAEHGPTQCLVDRLRPLLHKYKVNAYFAGHDHSMQHLSETHEEWTVHHVLSGAGALELASNAHESKVPVNSSIYSYPKKNGIISDFAAKIGMGLGAFVYTEVDKEKARFYYILGNMKGDHTFTLTPRI